MYLVDMNVWLEALLDQANSDEAQAFLARTPSAKLAITEFDLYSLCLVMTRLNEQELLRTFLRDVVTNSRLQVMRLTGTELDEVITIQQSLKLDFDDAYQYLIAVKYGYTLVSFDPDFANTRLGHMTPAQVLAESSAA